MGVALTSWLTEGERVLLAELTFQEEIWKALAGAVATAVLVTVAGGLVVNLWSARSDRRKHAYELRNALVQRCNQVAGSMYIRCQHARRELRGASDDKSLAILTDLDHVYWQFSVDQYALEAELGSRFGFNELPLKLAAEPPTGFVQSRWHQVADLLTVYYFNLKNDYPGDVLQRNSLGYEDRYHSGLDLVGMKQNPGGMRREVRRQYRMAMDDVIRSILTAPFDRGANL